MGIGAVPQRKDILQTGLRAGHSKASRADLNFTNAMREGLFLLALARAAPIARRLVAPPACGAFNVPEGLATFFVALSRAKQRAIFAFCQGRGQRRRVADLFQLLTDAGVPEIAI